MSARLAFSDFSLSQTPVRHYQYQLGFALAHSRRYNVRRLESHSYAPWGMISEDLLGGLSSQALSVSQLNFTSSAAIDGISPDISMKSFSPKDRKERTPDFTGIFLAAKRRGPDASRPEHLRNIENAYFRNDVLSQLFSTTEDPIDPTLPYQYSAIPLQLDVEFDPVPYLASEGLNWHLLKLGAYVTLFNNETKRPVSRRMGTADGFFNQLALTLTEAFSCADKQVEVIFSAEPETDSIISIASVGEFWSFRISIRDNEVKSKLFKTSDYAFLDFDATPPPSTSSKTSRQALSTESKPLRKEQTRGSLPSQWIATSSAPLKHAPGTRTGPASFLDNPDFWSGRDKNNRGPEEILDPVAEDDGEAEVWIDEDDWAARTGPSSVASDFEDGDRSFNDFSDLNAQSEGYGEAAEPDSDHPVAAGTEQRRTRRKKSEYPIRYLQPSNKKQATEMEKFVWKLRDALPELGQWIGPILFGTPASNQRFYMIRELLRNEIQKLESHYDYGIAPKLAPEITRGDPVANTGPQLTKDVPFTNTVPQAGRTRPIAVPNVAPKVKQTRSRSRSGR